MTEKKYQLLQSISFRTSFLRKYRRDQMQPVMIEPTKYAIVKAYHATRANIIESVYWRGWRGARVVEWATLLMSCARKRTEGSNPSLSAIFRKGFLNQKYGRREAPSVLHSPHKILILQGFATLRVAQKVRFDP